MLKVKNKRFVAAMLSIMLVLEMFVIQPKTAYAADVNIPQGKSESRVISSDGKSLSVLLYDASTSATVKSKPSWVTVSKNQYSTTFSVKISSNSNYSKRDGKVEFKEGSKTWTLKIMQSAKPTPTNTPKPTNKPKPKATNTPKPKATNTPKPKATNTPTPKLEASPSSVSFGANGGTTTVQTSGKVGTLRADRVNGDMWFVATASGGTVSIEVKANDGAVRTGYLDITDTGSGKSVRVTINQNAGATPVPQNPTTCDHTWGDWKTTKDAGCETTGTKTRSCTKCSAKQTQTIAKLGHKDDGKTTTKNATCTATGYTVSICSRCKKEIGTRTVIPAKGHRWGNWETDEEAKCEVDGKKHRTCTACGAREDAVITKLGHKSNGEIIRKDPTCTEDGYTVPKCYRCGAEVGTRTVIKASHKWGDWKTKEEPGCKTPGTKCRICSRCGESEEATIPALGHLVQGQVRTVTPAVGVDGYTVVVCSRCGAEMEGKKKIPALTATPTPTPTPKLKASRTSVSFPYTGKDKQGEQIQEEVSFSGVQGNISVDFETKDGKKPEWLNYTVKGNKIAFTVNPGYLQSVQTVAVIVKDTKTKKTIVITVTLAGCPEEMEVIHRPAPTPSKSSETPSKSPEPSSNPPKPSIGEEQGNRPTPELPDDGSVLDAKADNTPKPKPVPKPQQQDASGQQEIDVTVEDDDELHFEVNPSVLKFTSRLADFDMVKVRHCSIPVDIKYTIQSDAAWCKVSVSETNRFIYIIEVDENENDNARVGHIEFEDGNSGETAILEVVQPGRVITVDFYENKGDDKEKPIQKSYRVGENYELPEAPSNFGDREFLGWFTEPEPKKGIQITDGDPVQEDITALYAHYEAERVEVFFATSSYQYHRETVSAPKADYVHYGEPFGDIFPWVINPKNEKILVWQAVDEDGTYYTPNTIVNTKEKIILYPIWGYANQYMVFFDGNGSKEGSMDPETYEYDKEEELPEVEFDGGTGFYRWGTAPDGGNVTYKDRDKGCNYARYDEGNVTLFAQWKERGRVTYYDPIRHEPVVVETMSHIYTTLGIEEIPQLALEGFKLVGWKRWDSKEDIQNLQFIETKYKYGVHSECIADGDDWLLYPVYEKERQGRALILYNSVTNSVDVKFITGDTFRFPQASGPNDLYTFKYWIWDGPENERRQADGTTKIEQDKKRTEPGKDVNTRKAFGDRIYLIAETGWDFQPWQLILDYDYEEKGEEKKEEITVKEETYTLPCPERDGYLFRGWIRSDDPENETYDAGYNLPGEAEPIVLRADWEPLSYIVEYYDGITGELLADPQEYCRDERKMVKSTVAHLSGTTFLGWTVGKTNEFNSSDQMWTSKGLGETLFELGTYVSELPYNNRTIKLYSFYLLDETVQSGGETYVVYHPNKGSGAPSMVKFTNGGTLTIPKYDIQRKGWVFDGWELWTEKGGDGKRHKPLETITIPKHTGKGASIYYLVACWTQEEKTPIYLDPGFDNLKPIDLSEKYIAGDKVPTEELQKLLPDRPGYELLAFEAAYEGLYEAKGLHDSVFIPKKGIKITALWKKKELMITYHYGFDSSVVYQEDVDDPNTKLCFDSKKISFINKDGYTFLGWTLEDPDGSPCDISPDQIITAEKNRGMALDNNLDVYSCYKRWAAPENGLMVIYNSMGGEGGPEGVVRYDNVKDFRLSDKIPNRTGYTFDGWMAGSVEITNTNYEKYTCENVLELHARWRPAIVNHWKDELQSKYGKKIMPDFYFLTEYVSREWEKINDHCYFVISTEMKERYRDDCDVLMVSHVLIIDYNSSKGGWDVTGFVDSYQYMDYIKDEILIKYLDNDQARLGAVVADGVNFALKQIPYVKWVVAGVDIASSVGDLAYQIKEMSNAIFTKEIDTAIRITSSEVKSKLYELIRDVGSETEAFADVLLAEAFIVSVDTEIEKVVEKAITESKYEIIDGLNLIASAIKGEIKHSDELLKLVDKINQKVDKKIGTAILNGLSSRFTAIEKLKKNHGEKFGERLCTGIDAFVLIVTDLSKDIEYSEKISKDLDPFGDKDLELAKFYDKIDKGHYFGANIKNSFPNVIEKIYRATYPIN